MLLIAGTVAVTSAHLTRMRLLDLADGAALSAANALDDSAYEQGVGESVPLSNRSVQERAAAYLGSRPRPSSVSDWRLAAGTGTPDGRTAVVVIVGDARLPMIGPVCATSGCRSPSGWSRAPAPTSCPDSHKLRARHGVAAALAPLTFDPEAMNVWLTGDN